MPSEPHLRQAALLREAGREPLQLLSLLEADSGWVPDAETLQLCMTLSVQNARAAGNATTASRARRALERCLETARSCPAMRAALVESFLFVLDADRSARAPVPQDRFPLLMTLVDPTSTGPVLLADLVAADPWKVVTWGFGCAALDLAMHRALWLAYRGFLALWAEVMVMEPALVRPLVRRLGVDPYVWEEMAVARVFATVPTEPVYPREMIPKNGRVVVGEVGVGTRFGLDSVVLRRRWVEVLARAGRTAAWARETAHHVDSMDEREFGTYFSGQADWTLARAVAAEYFRRQRMGKLAGAIAKSSAETIWNELAGWGVEASDEAVHTALTTKLVTVVSLLGNPPDRAAATASTASTAWQALSTSEVEDSDEGETILPRVPATAGWFAASTLPPTFTESFA